MSHLERSSEPESGPPRPGPSEHGRVGPSQCPAPTGRRGTIRLGGDRRLSGPREPMVTVAGDALVGDPRTERQRDHQAYAREGSARPPAGRDRALPPGAPNHRSEGPTGQPYRAAEDLSQEVRVAFGGRYIELALLLENASGAKQRAPRSDRTSTKIHLLTSLACGCLASDPVIRRRRSKHTTFRLRRTL